MKGINRSTAVDIEVVRQFLADLRRNAEFVETAPDNMLGNPDAAKVSSTTATIIVRLPLDVRLSRVFLLAGVPGYGGILIAPEEVRAIAKADTPEVALSRHVVRQRLGLSVGVVKALMAPREGGALLPTIPGNNRSEFLVPVEQVEVFSRTM